MTKSKFKVGETVYLRSPAGSGKVGRWAEVRIHAVSPSGQSYNVKIVKNIDSDWEVVVGDVIGSVGEHWLEPESPLVTLARAAE